MCPSLIIYEYREVSHDPSVAGEAQILFILPLLLLLITAVACASGEEAGTSEDLSKAVQEAIQTQPQGATPQDVAAAVQQALSAQPGVTEAQVAKAIESALMERPGVSAEDVQKAVEAAVAKAQPTAADAPPSGEPKFGGIVPMHGFSAIIPRVHPRGSVASLHGLYGLFSHLVVYDSETPEVNDIACDLCTSWEVASDGMTHTFHLRKNAFWSDGVQ